MITIDFSVIEEALAEIAGMVDLILTAKIILSATPVFTAFMVLIFAVFEKRHRFSFFLTTLYLLLSAGYFALAYGDVCGRSETFKSVYGAAATSVAIFVVLLFVYLCLFFTAGPEKKSKKFVAHLVEVPIKEDPDEIKAYPLKGSADLAGKRHSDVDYPEFTKFLQKINEKDLSFSDREEYNRITTKADFLRGVAVTDKTAPDFCEIFSSSVKLGAKYGVE